MTSPGGCATHDDPRGGKIDAQPSSANSGLFLRIYSLGGASLITILWGNYRGGDVAQRRPEHAPAALDQVESYRTRMSPKPPNTIVGLAVVQAVDDMSENHWPVEGRQTVMSARPSPSKSPSNG